MSRRLGSLQRHHRQPIRDINHLQCGVALELIAEVVPIFGPVGRIDHQQIRILAVSVEPCVIDRETVFIRQDRVLAVAGLQGRDIAGQDPLEEIDRPAAPQQKPSHVRDIEQARRPPGLQMFLDNAAAILDRHLPSGEIHHLRPGGEVPIIQNRFAAFHGSSSRQ